MNNKELKSSERAAGSTNAGRCFELHAVTGQYTAPDIEVIDIELTQNFLGSVGTSGADLPTFEDGQEAW